MPDDKKKYPWIKSIFSRKKKKPTECVYAGPEMMNRRPVPIGRVYAGPPPVPERDKPVYAGPEVSGRKNRPDSLAEGLYAGPEYFGIKPKKEPKAPVIEDVYAGPEFFGEGRDDGPSRAETVEVYAGPEYFGFSDIPDGDGEDAEEPPSEDEDGDAQDGAPEEDGGEDEPAPSDEDDALPAPPHFPGRPPEAMMVAAYAGPRYPNSGPFIGMIGMMRPAPADDPAPAKPAPPSGGGAYCPCCGAKRLEGSVFCPECGTKYPAPEPGGENVAQTGDDKKEQGTNS